ncbi:MAG TPA: polysaccharide biosynthesis tyrosine autokinase [Candidatus Thiothrix moscowensis]|uniref:GumC family protein n=1 Tax=unclassified Thiothrix TaxID=2636184 RepID=UPI0025FAE0D1|nr:MULTISPECIES: polysaccharide biosynthesis tyrosine autokinase [unclassified Thiothrix]HRJ52325.1 polysaccharide biosynthesis tyrosine autokinase [Candidatus Thiothrix moscowensis]HRJ92640.1 polysaccharide biosynthesis tyrosine autokinase [Candidatus Thiothrix moscowensis]
MENYYITQQSKALDIRSGNNSQIIEYIPVEDAAPKQKVEEFGMGELWKRIMQRKGLFFAIAGGIFLLSILFTILTAPTYRASTTLQISAEDMRDLNINADNMRAPINEKDYYQTQYELLRSRNLAARVMEELGIQQQFSNEDGLQLKLYGWLSSVKETLTGEPLPAQQPKTEEDRFLKYLLVQPVENSQIFKISFDDESPQAAATIANSLAENYIKMNLERRSEAASYAKEFLTDQLNTAKVNLEDSENRMVAYAKKQGIITTDGQYKESLNSQSITEINRAFAAAQAERIAAEAAYRQSQHVAGADRTLENPAVQALKEQLARLQSDYQEKSQMFKPGYPEMQQLSRQISQLRSDIARESSSIDSTTRGSLQAAYQAAKQKEDQLRAELQKQKGALLDQRDRSVEYNTLEREVTANRENYEGLLQRMKDVSIAEGSGVSNVLVVDKATVPSQPYKPNVLLNLGIGTVAGLLLGLLAAILADMMDDRLRSVEDIKRTLSDVSLIGVIPFMTGKNNRNVLATSGDKVSSFMLEAFRSLRENTLLFKAPSEHHALIMNVTSPSASEGKTTTSVNLATVFAYTSKRVLLVDCDMRNPASHEKLNISNGMGLAEYLRGSNTLPEIMQETTVENLYAVTAGDAVVNPTELLASSRFASLLAEASAQFDVVVLDSPPVMGLADALIISNRSDNTLLVSAFGQTSKRSLKDAYERLMQARTNVIGTVLTKMKVPEVAKKYYGYPTRYPRNPGTAMVPQ